MFTFPRPPANREAAALASLAWLLASLACAATSHEVIDAAGRWAGPDAYAEHAHGAVIPVVVAAVAVASTLALASVAQRAARRTALDPVLVLARRFGSMPPLVPCLAVAAGGCATLLGMEFAEQACAFGHIEGFDDALGGCTLLGLGIVAAVGALMTTLGLRSARALLVSAFAAVDALVAWFDAKRPNALDCASIARRRQHPCDRVTTAAFAHGFGLRAPPPTLA